MSSTCTCQQEASDSQLMERLADVLTEYCDKPGALIPVLQHAQAIFGYLPEDALKQISVGLNKSYSEVAGVVSFYSYFSTVPRGKNLVRVCMGTACHVRGAPMLAEKLQRDMAVDERGNTADMEHTVESVNCVGACALGPLIIVDGQYHGNMTSGKVDRVYKSHGIAPMQGGGE